MVALAWPVALIKGTPKPRAARFQKACCISSLLRVKVLPPLAGFQPRPESANLQRPGALEKSMWTFSKVSLCAH